ACRSATQGGRQARLYRGLDPEASIRPPGGECRGAENRRDRPSERARGAPVAAAPAACLARARPGRGRPMNPLDLGVIAILVLSAIFAFARGFVREALSIIAWVGAAAITILGFNTVL